MLVPIVLKNSNSKLLFIVPTHRAYRVVTSSAVASCANQTRRRTCLYLDCGQPELTEFHSFPSQPKIFASFRFTFLDRCRVSRVDEVMRMTNSAIINVFLVMLICIISTQIRTAESTPSPSTTTTTAAGYKASNGNKAAKEDTSAMVAVMTSSVVLLVVLIVVVAMAALYFRRQLHQEMEIFRVLQQQIIDHDVDDDGHKNGSNANAAAAAMEGHDEEAAVDDDNDNGDANADKDEDKDVIIVMRDSDDSVEGMFAGEYGDEQKQQQPDTNEIRLIVSGSTNGADAQAQHARQRQDDFKDDMYRRHYSESDSDSQLQIVYADDGDAKDNDEDSIEDMFAPHDYHRTRGADGGGQHICTVPVDRCPQVSAILQFASQFENENRAVSVLDAYSESKVLLQNNYNHVLSDHANTQDFEYIYSMIASQFGKCEASRCKFMHDRSLILCGNHFINTLIHNIHHYIMHSYDFVRFTPHEIHSIEAQEQERRQLTGMTSASMNGDDDNGIVNIKITAHSDEQKQADEPMRKKPLIHQILETKKHHQQYTTKMHGHNNKNNKNNNNTNYYNSNNNNNGQYNKYTNNTNNFNNNNTNAGTKSDHWQRFMSVVNIADEANNNIAAKKAQEQEEDDEKAVEEKANNAKYKHVYYFGKRWQYWQKYMQYHTYVVAKYSDFKHEMLTNRICVVVLETWNNSLDRCSTLIQCDRAKKLIASNRILCHYYAIEYGSSTAISMYHMVALLLYTCQDTLQSELTKTFRLSNEYREWSAVQQANSEYGHWSRYLREAVEIFGTQMRNVSAQYILYHGIGKQLLFPSTISSFASPTSATTLQSVAHQFCDSVGLIVELMKYGLDLCFFDCSWMSHYANEEERLFIGGHQPLIITNIVLGSDLTLDYQRNIRCMNVLQSLIEGRHNRRQQQQNDRKKKRMPSNRKVKRRLRKLIEYKLNGKNASKKYIYQLFYYFCENWKEPIVINVASQLLSKENYLHISDLFYDKNNNNILDFKLLMKLFNNCPKISICDGFELSEAVMERLLAVLMGITITNRVVYQVEFVDPKTGGAVVGHWKELYAASFDDIGWTLSAHASVSLLMNGEMDEDNHNGKHNVLLLTKQMHDETTRTATATAYYTMKSTTVDIGDI